MSTDSVPVWLLDFDGVVNATHPGWRQPPLRRSAFDQNGVSWEVRFSLELIWSIRRLIDQGVVEIYWSSTWCGYTASIEHAVGLPSLPSAFMADPADPTWHRMVPELKLAAARSVLESDRRLIWTDDTEVPRFGPLLEELTAGGRGLLIRPTERRGLQPADLDAIGAFCGFRDRPVRP